MRIPGSTYRLQFNKQFRFEDALAIVDYLSELGITDVYASPIFTAPPDSNHGYDVCNYNELNPAIGSTDSWNSLTDALRRKGMGLLLDFVPNHMGAAPEYNPWWRDVLEFGVESRYSRFFDINWDNPDPGMNHRIVLPILEDHYGIVLEKGLLKLAFKKGAFEIRYRDLPLPLHPGSYRKVLEWMPAGNPNIAKKLIQLSRKIGSPPDRNLFQQLKEQLASEPVEFEIEAAFAKSGKNLSDSAHQSFLDDLLDDQIYRLVIWRTGTRIANYRRFFDVDSLIAVNMSRREVFDEAHELVKALIQKGQVAGLRLDHIDGLADPKQYLQNLQATLTPKANPETTPTDSNLYVLVEKILMNDEKLPHDWQTAGTTGYDFGAAVTNVLVDSSHESAFTRIYYGFVPGQLSFADILKKDKQWMMAETLSREINGLVGLLKKCAAHRRTDRDLLSEDLAHTITATIENFDVYRTYINKREDPSFADRATVERALSQARSSLSEMDPAVFKLLGEVLLLQTSDSECAEVDNDLFRQRFQQFTGPIMAKSYEDTAFFVYNRLIALNEVGGNPDRFGIGPLEFHQSNTERQRDWPHAMLTTSTHDTKLSEDARARVAAISQVPSIWADFIETAASANAPFKSFIKGSAAPDRNEEYLLYQILLGTWPLEEMDVKSRETYTKRIQRHMLKAVREAKIHTRWDRQNRDWEKALEDFVYNVINQPSAVYEAGFRQLSDLIGQLGMLNSLSQILLKLTAPGVPDFFQGNELWQFILTDPDNRGTINYGARQKILASLPEQSPASLLKNWRNGAIKIFLTKTILNFRRTNPLLFAKGEYIPLELLGAWKDCCIAFARVHEKQHLVIVAPRLTARIGFPPIGELWQNTTLDVESLGIKSSSNLFTGERFSGFQLSLKAILGELPFAALVG